MIVKVPDTKLYTVWVDFQSGSIHIYNVECLTFDKQQAEKYMADRVAHFPERKYEIRVFNVGGIGNVSTSSLRREINNRKKKKQEDERRMLEMEEWVRFHPEEWPNLGWGW